MTESNAAASPLVSVLRDRSESILRRWIAALRAGVAPADATEPELRDHVPDFLRALGEALRSGDVRETTAIARAHGRQREEIGFDLGAVVREYHLLNGLVLDAAVEDGVVPTASDVRVLTDAFALASAEGVSAHARYREARDAGREEASRAAARAHERTLHDVFALTPVAIAILEGPAHRFAFANRAYRELVDGADVVGRTVAEALPFAVERGHVALLDHVRETGDTYFGRELPLKLAHHHEDENLFVNFVYSPRRGADGAVDGVVVTAWNVTDLVEARRRVEALSAESRANEARLRLVIDALPVLVSFVTADERYGLVNKTYEAWFGASVEAIRGRKAVDVIGEDAYAVMGPHIRRALAGEAFSFEQPGVRYPNAPSRDLKVSYVPHRDADGAVEGFVALLEDVTRHRALERERERLLRQRAEVLESMGDAFFALDPEWRFTLVNRRYEEVSGKTREETLGRVFWETFPDAADPASHYFRAYHRCMAERVEVAFVDYYPSLDLWTDVRVYPTADGGISIFFRDVSVTKRAEEALRVQADFEQQLIGIVSHDLKNPLNVILLAAKVMTMFSGLGDGDRANVMRIQNAAERANRLVRDLLDFAQGRLGGGIPVDPRPTDLHALVRAAVDELGHAFPGRRVEVRAEGDGGAEIDPDRVAQVVQNLAANALKYSPPESVVEVVTRGDGEDVVLVVRNEGSSIPADKLPTIFEPFKRASGQVDAASRSVGLGLYIVNEVVKAHRGSVVVRSTVADGTTFTVRLPRRAGG